MISGLQPYREIREGKVEVPLLQISVEQWRHLVPRKAGKPHCWMTFGDPKCLRATFQEHVAPNWMLWIQKKGPKIKLGSEFQTFFIFNLTWGDDSIWLIFFEWVETTNQKKSGSFLVSPEAFQPPSFSQESMEVDEFHESGHLLIRRKWCPAWLKMLWCPIKSHPFKLFWEGRSHHGWDIPMWFDVLEVDGMECRVDIWCFSYQESCSVRGFQTIFYR